MKRHLSCLSKTVLQNNTTTHLPFIRFLSTKEAIERRNHLFTLEKNRQMEKVGRMEKIEVTYKGIPEECTMIMNKDISTPFDCARHLSEWHTESSALALLDGSVYWDMHRPLSENCTLEFQNFTVAEPQQVNKAFWRTCSLALGACALQAFKDSVAVNLHSFPGPDIRSGSFIYDIDLPTLPDWKPTEVELRTLSAEYIKLIREKLSIERLEVGEELAKEMFVENKHKGSQIPSIAKNNGGPDSEVKQLYRFQGVALPTGVILNHFAYSILTERAKKLNNARSPINPFGETVDSAREPVAASA
ncbi:39S ribosomal protein L39, mitochondrial isoform X2 [Hyposmocoma kahamanoa]|uniref:39S ribosomal protein L39, mitochondrial isoform X2 n=1 Tax=Hyposmocoma kahamanoa TaxID=1477025 RepID=UPI000E6D6EA4|nr:39S ribosomal protein L39, mitochondrial isoform X2 [Hyposmocoma kahamanoa]